MIKIDAKTKAAALKTLGQWPSDDDAAILILEITASKGNAGAIAQIPSGVRWQMFDALTAAGLLAEWKGDWTITREGLRVLAGLRPLALTTPALQEDALRRVRQELDWSLGLALHLTNSELHEQIKNSIRAAINLANWTHENWILPDPAPTTTPTEAATGC